MAVPAGTPEKRYTGNGVSTAFTIPFLLIAATDLDVFVNGVEVVSGYTITGAGNPTSTITFTSAPANLSDILLRLNVPFERLNDYQENGDFLASTVNRDFDRIWQALKQLFLQNSRSPVLGINDVDGAGAYRAKGNKISDLADPVSPQDAVTKNWVSLLIDSVSGIINTTTGILYDAGTLFDFLRFSNERVVDSVAALRLLSGSRNRRAFVLGYYANGDGGGGAYFIDQADTTSADNGGTIIVAADGSRWKLSTPYAYSLKQFGAKFDGVTNDNAAWVNAFTYAVALTNVSITVNAGKSVITGGIPLGSGSLKISVKGAGRSSRILWSATMPLFSSGASTCDELSFADFVIDNTGSSTVLANAAFSFPEGNTRTDFTNIHLLPNLATNKCAPSFYLCGIGKTNDSVNFNNCYAFINKYGARLGAGSSVWFVGGRIAGTDPVSEASTGIGLTGGMGGVWVVGTDLIGATTGIYVGQDSGVTNRELFLISACTDSCSIGLNVGDSRSYI